MPIRSTALLSGTAVARNGVGEWASDWSNWRCNGRRQSYIDTNGQINDALSVAPPATAVGHQHDELFERAQRHRRRHHRDEQHVGQVDHQLGRQRHPGGQIEQHGVIVPFDAGEQLVDAAGGLAAVVEVEIEMAQRDVSGHHVETDDVGGA